MGGKRYPLLPSDGILTMRSIHLRWAIVSLVLIGAVDMWSQSGTYLPSSCTAGSTYTYTGTTPPITVVCVGANIWVPQIGIDQLAIATDTTTGDASTSAHGLLPKLSGNPSHVLKGDGTWGVAGGTGVPSGGILLVDSGSCPSGYTEQAGLNGKTVIGTLDGSADVGTTGGADSVTPSAHSGAAVADHASHTHTYAQVINHTHAVSVNDPTHNHTQNAHTHIVTSQTATTGSATSYEHGTLDTSSAEAEQTEVTGSTTATNQAAATGVTASTQNPVGGVASGTSDGPSATLTHAVTQPATHAALDNRSAFVKAIFCQKD